jgi:hypothetical protein
MEKFILNTILLNKIYEEYEKEMTTTDFHYNDYACKLYKQDTNEKQNNNNFPVRKVITDTNGVISFDDYNTTIFSSAIYYDNNLVLYKEKYDLIVKENYKDYSSVYVLNYLFYTYTTNTNFTKSSDTWLNGNSMNYTLSNFRIGKRQSDISSLGLIKTKNNLNDMLIEMLNTINYINYYPTTLCASYLNKQLTFNELMAQTRLLDMTYDFGNQKTIRK